MGVFVEPPKKMDEDLAKLAEATEAARVCCVNLIIKVEIVDRDDESDVVLAGRPSFFFFFFFFFFWNSFTCEPSFQTAA